MTDTAPAPEAPKKTTLTVLIDGTPIEANPGELLIAAAERTGTYIPRFCWHPRMQEVGMCRMCLVEVSGPRGMSLQPACMQPCAEGMTVDTKSPLVKKAQDGVLEFLLINHPLDCPVCDKGGECPLQDQTLTFGPGESRFVEEKRHYEKPIPISDLVLLDRERCILCDRCTRFSKEVSGDPLIHFINRGNATEVNTFPDDPYASYFSGNVVQICPVGALTAQPYRFAARPWDLDQVESTCTTCSVGCRVVVQSSGDEITRVQGVDADPVNWGWLCDKGRFDFESIGAPDRLTVPLVRTQKGVATQTSSWTEALGSVADRLRTYQPSEVGFIGGARLTNEDQYALAKFAKSVVRTDNVDAQLGDGLPAHAWLGLAPATIDEACNASAVIVLTADIKEELPVLFLRLRDASHKRVPIIEITPTRTGLSPYAKATLAYRAGEAAVAARALLSAISGSEPDRQVAGVEAADLQKAATIMKSAIESGKGNGKVVVIFGRSSLAESTDSIVDALGVLSNGIANAAFLPAMRRSNLRGALDFGLTPGMLPGRVSVAEGASWFAKHWGSGPSATGLDTESMLRAAVTGELKALVLVGADPLADFPDRALAAKALASASFVVSIDTMPNASNTFADVLLPAAGYAEKSGTTTNLEGRVSNVRAKVSAPGLSRPDWMIFAELALELGTDFGFESVDDITAEIAAVCPSHLGLTTSILNATKNADGVVVPLPVALPVASSVGLPVALSEEIDSTRIDGATDGSTELPDASTDAVNGSSIDAPAVLRVPALVEFKSPSTQSMVPLPDSYSLRLVTSRVLYDNGTLVQASSSLAKLAPGAHVRLHPGEVERHALLDGATVRVVSQTAEVSLRVVADDRVPRGAAFVPFNQAGPGAADLIDLATMATDGVTKVRLESVPGAPA
jgi:NADH-quinone oxidoreductase subunit G